MKKMRFYEVLFVMLLLSLNALAQTTIEGEYRPRIEARDGFRKPLADSLRPAYVGLQRTRLSLNYKSNLFNTQLTVQDSRTFGNNDTKSSTSKIEVYEAWAELFLIPSTSVTIGRQALKYDDERLFTVSNWSNTGIAHDLALFKYKNKDLLVHGGFAYNNNYADSLSEMSYTTSKMYKTMGYLWASKKLMTGLNLSVIGVAEGFQKSTKDFDVIYPRYTYGGNLVYLNDSSRLGFTLTGYGQAGKSSANSKTGFDDLSAFFLAFKVNYKIVDKLSAFAGADLYSGSSPTLATGKSNTFNRLYGSTHNFDGAMEYWSTLPKAGLVHYFAGLNSKLNNKLSLNASYHIFRLEQDFSKTNKGRNLGSEIDLKLNYAFSKEAIIEAGYSNFLMQDLTKQVDKIYKSGSTKYTTADHQWFYVMLTIKPQFYKTPEVKSN
jgi:hypothetical protein